MKVSAAEDVFFVRDLSQAIVLLNPMRLDLLRRMDAPRSCPELGQLVGETPQKVYYHVKALESARLVDKVAERRVGGIMEGLYRARARSYWLAPELVGNIGGAERARDQMSLGYLLSLAEQLQSDVAELAAERDETPSLGLSADIVLADDDERDAFLHDVQEAVQSIAQRYGARAGAVAGRTFRLVLACYPRSAAKKTLGKNRRKR